MTPSGSLAVCRRLYLARISHGLDDVLYCVIDSERALQGELHKLPVDFDDYGH